MNNQNIKKSISLDFLGKSFSRGYLNKFKQTDVRSSLGIGISLSSGYFSALSHGRSSSSKKIASSVSTSGRSPIWNLVSYKKADAVLHLKKTRNNTIIALTNKIGKVKSVLSAGCLGLTGPRRATVYAGERVCEQMAKLALKMGYKRVIVKTRGTGYGRSQCVKAIAKTGLKILLIEEVSSIPHNGCRAKKARRK
uniref:Ribosomal protein S11 n=1 Tax=Oltmannsiellopsis viridis TaxID=51324 RepID=Q0QIP5_OLTVI|nr:ribosomal protein S11 [Oltmannsiellopsis viridis]ABC96358.1 ribosomal protein S11 [Oltmannsiellopsis viridis]